MKYKDPNCPIISCITGNTVTDKTLLDLGSSVDLLPLSAYQQLKLSELKPTRITQLADRSNKPLHGVVEDVLIKVGEFIFLVDFIVVETQPVTNLKGKIPVILGRPFLSTSNAVINCPNRLMKLPFRNMIVDMNVFNLYK